MSEPLAVEMHHKTFENSGHSVADDFEEFLQMVDIGLVRGSSNRTLHQEGRKVRQTIQDLGSTMPEDLPTSDKSIGRIEHRSQKKVEKK